MNTIEVNAKTKLNDSKARLAQALNRLETVIEQELNSDIKEKSLASELAILTSKIELLSKENKKLGTDYDKIKSVSSEVLEELNTAIVTIESLVQNLNGNSGSNNK